MCGVATQITQIQTAMAVIVPQVCKYKHLCNSSLQDCKNCKMAGNL